MGLELQNQLFLVVALEGNHETTGTCHTIVAHMYHDSRRLPHKGPRVLSSC